MSDVFISYARSTEAQARKIADALRRMGYAVWSDDELPAHRDYSEVIEERLRAAKAVVVLWSAEAAKSQWVRAEADLAREAGTLVQLNLDGAALPMPFNRVQCADLAGWSGDLRAPGWTKVVASVGELVGAPHTQAPGGLLEHPALPDKPSVAVLPLANLSGDPEQDYFADGMVVEIVTALSRFPSLFVIAAGSSLTFRGADIGRARIAEELGVRYLVDGSVRKSGQRVRITVELIDAREGAQVWSERFDGTLEDVFALQDEVANAVAARITPAVEAAEVRRASAKPTTDLRAYDLVLRARHLTRRYSRSAFLKAIDLLEKAIARDPNYAQALAFAALCHGYGPGAGWSDDPAGSRKVALELGRRAMQAGGDDPEVLTDVATAMAFMGGDLATADTMIERAIFGNPSLAGAWLGSGWIKVFHGQAQTALLHLETGARLDPRTPHRSDLISGMGFSLLLLGRYDEAITRLKEAVQLQPNQGGSWVGLAAALAHAGRIDEAKDALARLEGWPAETMLKLIRDDRDREFLRTGLAQAGADV